MTANGDALRSQNGTFHKVFDGTADFEELLSASQRSKLGSARTAASPRSASQRSKLGSARTAASPRSAPRVDLCFPLLREVARGFLTQKISTDFSSQILLNAIGSVALLAFDAQSGAVSLRADVFDGAPFAAAELLAEHRALAAVARFAASEVQIYDFERERAFEKLRTRAESAVRVASAANAVCVATSDGFVELFDLRCGERVFGAETQSAVTSLELFGQTALVCGLDALRVFDLRVERPFGFFHENRLAFKYGIARAQFAARKGDARVIHWRVGARKVSKFDSALGAQSPLRLQTPLLSAAANPRTGELAVLQQTAEAMSVALYSAKANRLRGRFDVPSDCYDVHYDRNGENLICIGAASLRIHCCNC